MFDLKPFQYFFIFTVFLFLGMSAFETFSDGMFVDGLWYAAISRNMAEGLGTFWQPYFTDYSFPDFYEHPPLALGLQSIAFSIFGDSIFVERIYSWLTFFVTGYIMYLIWVDLTNDKKTGWLPLFLWSVTSGTVWSAANNMLENTMMIFTCLCFLFYLKSLSKKQWHWLVLSGVALSLAFLSKGPFCLYLWSAPFFFWLINRTSDFKSTVVQSVILVASTVGPIVLLCLFVPAATNNLLSYLDVQVIKSVSSVVTVKHRFEIVQFFFDKILLPSALTALFLIIGYLVKESFDKVKVNGKISFTLFLIALAGVLPIMISLKQREFYIQTVFPFVVLGLAYLIHPFISVWLSRLNPKSKGFLAFKILTSLVVIASIGLSIYQSGKIGRDKSKITDVKQVIEHIGKHQAIHVCKSMSEDQSLHGYFMRYGYVSIDSNYTAEHQYFMTYENCYSDSNYILSDLELKRYHLFERK